MFGIKEKLKRIRLNCIGVKYGKNIELGNNINFGSEPYLIKIGDNVRISSNVNFITHDGGMWTLRKLKLVENGDYFGRIEIRG